MNRILVTAFLLATSACCSAATADDRPNIVLVMVDELGYYEPGFMGGKTP